VSTRVHLPQQMQNIDFRFVKIKRGTKKPFELEWTDRNNYKYNQSELVAWLFKGQNYGVVCGYGGLVVIDIDNKDFDTSKFPKTFVVRTGGGGLHFYYLCPEIKKSFVLQDKGVHFGEVQASGRQVVGVGSLHPSGKLYLVENRSEIAETTKEQLKEALGNLFVEETTEKTVVLPISTSKILPENIKKLIDSGVKERLRNKTTWIIVKELFNLGYDSYMIEKMVLEFNSNCTPPRDLKEVKDHLKQLFRNPKYLEKRVTEEEMEKLQYGHGGGWIGVNSRDFFDGSRFISKRLADCITRKYIFKTTNDTEEIFVYQDGVYKPNGETIIKEEASKLLGEDDKKHYANEVLHRIQATTYVDRNSLDINLVNVKNGIFDLEKKELLNHDSNLFTTTQLPIMFDKNADCPEIKKFLSEVLHPNDIAKIQEFIGYCVYRDYIFHKAFLLIGDGSNGKSTFMDMLSVFLGRDNISGIALQDLDINRFSLSKLYGKLANIYDDLPNKSLKNTGRFKMVTGNSILDAEQKFRDWIRFKNHAKMIFSCNAVPETSDDDSDAFFRRWELITFPNKFEGEECDPNKLKKITTEEELNGLFNFALEGLGRLIKNGGFSHSKNTDDIREQYNRLSSPTKAFFSAKVKFDYDGSIEKQKLYQAFIDYCHENNLPTITDGTFGKKVVENFGSRVKGGRPGGLSGRKYVWKGIKLGGEDV